MAIRSRALLIAAGVATALQIIFQLINSGTLMLQYVGGADVTQMTNITQAVGSLLCVCGLLVDIAGGILYAYLGGRESPVSAGNGALGGASAGLSARFISTAVGSCISVVLIPMFQSQAVADLPPEAADVAAGLGVAGGIIGIFISLCIFLVFGGIFGAIGGAIGGATVGKGRAT